MITELEQMARSVPLVKKVDKAIAVLRHYEGDALKRDPANGYWLGDSYGKDSAACRRLCQMAGVRFCGRHNLTTVDAPELIRFGRKHHPDTVELRPDEPMLVRLPKHARGMPTRRLAWCCEQYKHRSIKNGEVAVLGIRHAESKARVKRWKQWTPFDGGKRWVVNPILFWSDDELWEFINSEKVPYCPLYDEGFTRLGCVGCPKSSNQRKEFARWPGFERAWRRACDRWWENWHDKPKRDGTPRWFVKRGITSADEYWAWWMNELPEPYDDGCQMGLW